jgi:hypothetical protein
LKYLAKGSSTEKEVSLKGKLIPWKGKSLETEVLGKGKSMGKENPWERKFLGKGNSLGKKITWERKLLGKENYLGKKINWERKLLGKGNSLGKENPWEGKFLGKGSIFLGNGSPLRGEATSGMKVVKNFPWENRKYISWGVLCICSKKVKTRKLNSDLQNSLFGHICM